jgi:signal transduction histidine kinase
MIKGSSEIIENFIQEIRKLSHALIGPKSGEFLLQESLKDLLKSIEVGTSLNVEFAWQEVDETEIGEKKKIVLYRIAQEQLNNINKYAKAKMLT